MDNVTNQDGLRIIAAPRDRRADDAWAYDDEFCHQFLLHITATHPEHQGRAVVWKRAIERYWREKCSRRELADELQIGIDATKSLLTLIRKAAEKFKADGHAGFKSEIATTTASWNGRVHSAITANDVGRIIDGDREAIAHAEEYHRLTIRNQLGLFDPHICKKLEELANQSDALGDTRAAGHLITEANRLKAKFAKDDPFVGRPMFQDFAFRKPNYREDMRGRPHKPVLKIRERVSAESLIPAEAPRLFLVPTSEKKFTKEVAMLNARHKTVQAVKDWDIGKSDLAQLADVLPSRVSDYCSGKRVPPAIATKIEEATADVVKVWSGLQVRIDITDQRGFQRALETVEAAIAKVDAEDAAQTSQPDLESLRLRPA